MPYTVLSAILILQHRWSYSRSQIICYIIVVLKVLKFRNSITSYPPAVAILLHYYPFPLILARRHWNHALRLINNIPIRILQFNSTCPSINITLQFTTKVFKFLIKTTSLLLEQKVSSWRLFQCKDKIIMSYIMSELKHWRVKLWRNLPR